MDMFKDYNAYRQFRPQYAPWKEAREKQEAKRLAYLEKHPELKNTEDIERGKTILHAIDTLDEYSQAKAENTELETEIISQQILSGISTVGALASFAVIYKTKALRQMVEKLSKKSETLMLLGSLIPMAIGGLIASITAFPIMAWAAKTETGASRKGRLEAMQTKLKNPANFAILTEEQKQKLEEETKKIKLSKEEEKLATPKFSFKESIQILKDIPKQKEIERKEQEKFQELIHETAPNNKDLQGEALEKAKRDQQILTKLVEKIDIASQDYAENVEMATNCLAILSPLAGAGIGWLSNKANNILKIGAGSKGAKIAPWAIGLVSTMGLAIFSTTLQKQASRVARFNIRQELAKNPEKLIYVDDEKVNAEIDDKISLTKKEKPNFFKFLWQVYKDNKAYKKYQKTQGIEDKKRNIALEKIELSEEQLRDAKALQANTFNTFNKVDAMSQKYSENIEALGNALKEPLTLICTTAGMLVGLKYLNKIPEPSKTGKKALDNINNVMIGTLKYLASIFVSLVPILAFDFYITKQQKEASRIANMKAINELNDINNYNRYTTTNSINEAHKTEAIDEKKPLS